MNDRRTQMKWLLALTALSLVPVYILIGWQSGGHGPDTVVPVFWLAEAGAWGLRALVEAWALIYLFQTASNQPGVTRLLMVFEGLLIGLIALTVGLVIIANGNQQPISTLPPVLFWVWSFSVAAFAPLMMGSVGFAFKVHEPVVPMQPIIDKLQPVIDELQYQVKTLSHRDVVAHKAIDNLNSRCDDLYEQTHNPIVSRREAIRDALQGDNPPTHKALAKLHGVSVGTIGNDVRALNGSVAK